MEKYYHFHGEQLSFYKKGHIKTLRLIKKKDVFVIFILQETKNSNIFGQNRTQDNVKYDIQHEDSWHTRIVIELVNYQ